MKTRDTITQAYLYDEEGTKYKGLREAADEAYLFLHDAHEKGLTSSQMIQEMTTTLEYVLHLDSVMLAYKIMLDNLQDSTEEQKNFIERLIQKDDLGLYICNDELDITYTAGAHNNYNEYVWLHTGFTAVVPEFPLIDGNDILPESNSDIDVPKYIKLTTPEPEPVSSTPSSTGMGIEFDTPNKQILLYTIIAFGTIQLLAWYFKDDTKKNITDTNVEQLVDNEVLTSANETVYLDPTVIYKLLLGLIPIWLVIIYKKRYYYYYKFMMFIKNKKNNA